VRVNAFIVLEKIYISNKCSTVRQKILKKTIIRFLEHQIIILE